MSKFFLNALGISIAILGNGLLFIKVALAAESYSLTDKKADLSKSVTFFKETNNPIGDITSESQLISAFDHISQSEIQDTRLLADQLEDAQPLGQINSVFQLSDVESEEWAFRALQSLVERYGCIAGYPNVTYTGNRPITRYEFAANLNACLGWISKLIATVTNDLVIREKDLATLQKLQEEFAVELASLRGRVDAVQAKASELEGKQFSTTTKLKAEVITYISDTFGFQAGSANNATINYRMRLNFNTSFTGRDRLSVSLQAANLSILNVGNPNIDNRTGGFGAPQRYASSFPNAFSDEARVLPSSTSKSSLRLSTLNYDFPINDKLKIYFAASVTDPTYLGVDPISPFNNFATGSISNFANSNPIYYPMGQRAGAGLSFKIKNSLVLSGGYIGQDLNNVGGSNIPSSSSGIFKGGYTAFSQLTFYGGNLTGGLIYLNTYTPQFGIDTLAGSNSAKVSTGGFSTPNDDRVSANHYGFVANYKVNEHLQVGGWIGYSNARVLGVDSLGLRTGNYGDVKVLNYAVILALPDLGAKGNFGGFVFGMQPKVIDTSNARIAQAIGLPDGRRSDRDTGFHIEAFYQIQFYDNISITAGVFWLTAPNHDDRNSDVIIGVVRTSFVF